MGPELAGIRVDTLLKRHLGLSGTVVRRIKWLSDGILVDGRRVNTRYAPRAGEVLSVCLSDPEQMCIRDRLYSKSRRNSTTKWSKNHKKIKKSPK